MELHSHWQWTAGHAGSRTLQPDSWTSRRHTGQPGEGNLYTDIQAARMLPFTDFRESYNSS
jgi:hypothetical protein